MYFIPVLQRLDLNAAANDSALDHGNAAGGDIVVVGDHPKNLG